MRALTSSYFADALCLVNNKSRSGELYMYGRESAERRLRCPSAKGASVWRSATYKFVLLIIAMFLAACGGGGGSADAPNAPASGRTPPVPQVTLSGTATSQAPISGATVKIISPEGTSLGNSTTSSTGTFSLTLNESQVANGYEVEVTSGSVDGQPNSATLRAFYGPEGAANSNVTFITTLIEKLAVREDGQSRKGRRDTAISRLSGIGALQSTDWSALNPVGVVTTEVNGIIGTLGLDRWTELLVEDIRDDGELSPAHMTGFANAHGGLIEVGFGTDRNSVTLGGLTKSWSITHLLRDPAASLAHELLTSVEGLSVSSNGVVTYHSPQVSDPQRIQFDVGIENSASGKGRILKASITTLESEVIIDGSLGPQGGQLTDPWEEVILQVPPGSMTTSARLRVLRAIDNDGHSIYSVEAPPELIAPATLITPPSVQPSTTEAATLQAEGPVKQIESSVEIAAERDWQVVEKNSAKFVTFVSSDGTYEEGNRLRRSESCPVLGYFDRFSSASLECRDQTASELYRRCPQGDCRGLTPVLFIHGYTPGGKLGGGEDTWGNLREYIGEVDNNGKYVAYEFRWKTNANYKDVALDLEGSIKTIASQTGRRVHIIAHSFGGLLARTYLQGLTDYRNPPRPFGNDVQSLVTIGTPHSGIFDTDGTYFGVSLPKGQDPAALNVFEACGQISCQEAGEPTEGAFKVLGVDLSRFFGTELKPGRLIYELSTGLNVSSRTADSAGELPVESLILMGLTNKLTDASPSGRILEKKFTTGDGLISFEGQRIIPNRRRIPVTGLPIPSLPQKTVERILGEHERTDIASSAIPEDVVTRILREKFDNGYKHSYWNGFLGQEEVNVRDKDHHTYQEISNWLTVSDEVSIPRFELKTRIRDAGSDAAVQGALVTLYSRGHKISDATTNSGGEVVLSSTFYANETYDISVIKSGYRRWSGTNGYISGDTIASTATEFGQIRLTPDLLVKSSLSGTIVDAVTGAPIGAASYRLSRNFLTVRRGVTDFIGRIVLTDLVPATYSLRLEKPGYLPQDVSDVVVAANRTNFVNGSMTPLLTSGIARIRLEWGANPADLDSHLYAFDGTQQAYRVYYSNKRQGDASLDVDDRSGFGPETITINPLGSGSRSYRYFVNHFDGTGSIATSSAVVTFTIGSSSRTFRAPNIPGTWWRVFDIVDGQIVPCQEGCITSSRPASVSDLPSKQLFSSPLDSGEPEDKIN